MSAPAIITLQIRVRLQSSQLCQCEVDVLSNKPDFDKETVELAGKIGSEIRDLCQRYAGIKPSNTEIIEFKTPMRYDP